MVSRRRVLLGLAAAVAIGVGVVSWMRAGVGRGLPRRFGATPAASPAEAVWPRIDLARLAHKSEPPASTSRDLFRFGKPPAPAETPRPLVVASLPQQPVEVAPATPPPPVTLPPFAVKYVGTVEQRGMRVAVLVSDERKEVLTGREGDVVANRLRIVKIGLESVDVQDLGSERVRRIPLKGN
jgi:hypothetical protein